MTTSASDANELLCDNNTVKTHRVKRSDFLTKTQNVKSNYFYLQQQHRKDSSCQSLRFFNENLAF